MTGPETRRRRDDDGRWKYKASFGVVLIVAAVVSRALGWFSEWPALVMVGCGALLISDERITGALRAWRRNGSPT